MMLIKFVFSVIALYILCSSDTTFGQIIDSLVDIVDVDLTNLKNNLMQLVDDGAFHEVLTALREIEDLYGHLAVDKKMPSLFSIQGVAYAGLFEHNKTVESFQNAVKYYPKELRAWINLGETYQMSLEIPKAIKAFYAACELGDESSLIRVLSAKGWATDW